MSRSCCVVRIVAGLLLSGLLSLAQAGDVSERFGRNEPYRAPNGWQALRGAHVTLLYPDGKDVLAPRVLESADAALADIGERLGVSIEGRTTWVFFRSRRLAARSNIPSDELDEAIRAWSPLLRHRRVLVFDGSTARLEREIRHAATHVLQEKALYPNRLRAPIGLSAFFHPPDWFLEGVALYFAGPPDAADEIILRGASLANRLLSLSEIADFNEVSDLALAYMEGLSAVAFLAETYGLDVLGQLLRALADHPRRDFDAVLRSELDTTLRALNRRWLRHVKKRYWPLVREKDAPETFAKALAVPVDAFVTDPAWSKSGEVLACVARGLRHDDILLVSAEDGSVLRNATASVRDRFEFIETRGRSVDWSPDGDAVVFIAYHNGALRLLIVDVITGEARLDIPLPFEDAFSPVFDPNGRRLFLMASRGGPTDLYALDLDNIAWTRLTEDPFFDTDLAIDAEGTSLLYVSERGGTTRLVRYDLESGIATVLLDGAGGVHTPGWVAQPDTFFFAADWSGTRDLYLAEHGGSEVRRLTNLIAGVESASLSPDGELLAFSAALYGREGLYVLSLAQSVREEVSPPVAESSTLAEPVGEAGVVSTGPPPSGLVLDDVMADLFTPSDGIPRLELNALAASWTGDTRLMFRVTSSPLSVPSFRVRLGWLKLHADIEVELSRRTTFHRPFTADGELAADADLVAVRELDAALRVRYPLGITRRLELEFAGSDGPLAFRYVLPVGERSPDSTGRTLAVTASFVHDNVASLDRIGPLEGLRYRLDLSAGVGTQDVRALSLRFDGRGYRRLGRRTVFAGRTLIALGNGPTPERFTLGGHRSFRAFPYEAVDGSRLVFMSAELRVPIVDELQLAWPFRIGIETIRGVFFVDVGSVWSKGRKLVLARRTNDGLQLEDLFYAFGFGLRTELFGLRLRWDLARPYDLVRADRWRSLLRIDNDF